MESKVQPENETIVEKDVAVRVEAGTVVVAGLESIGHDVGTGAVEAGRIVVAGGKDAVEGTKNVLTDIPVAVKQLGQDVKQVVTPAPSPAQTEPIPIVAAPVA